MGHRQLPSRSRGGEAWSRSTWVLLIFIACGVACGVACGPAAPRSGGAGTGAGRHADSTLRRAQKFSEVWSYRLGTSPRTAGGDWLWAQPDFDDGRWLPSPHAGKAPVRSNHHELWARVRLTGPALKSPTLSLQLFGYGPEVYIEGKRQTLQELPHHPWEEQHHHGRRFLLHLDTDYVGKTLHVHIYANSQRIGVLDPVYLGEPAAVMASLIGEAAGRLLQGFVVGFVGLVAALLFLAVRADKALLYFSLFCFATASFLLGSGGMLSLLFNVPIPSTVLFTFSGPVGTCAFCGFLLEVLQPSLVRPLRWPRNALVVGITCEVAALAYDVRYLVFLTRPMLVLMLLTAVLVLFTCVRSARDGQFEGKLICGGLGLGLLTLLPDILTLSGLWPRATHFSLLQVGFFFIFSALGMVMVRRFMAVYKQLGLYSEMLSEQVRVLERRNTDIQNLNDELRRQIEQRSERMIEILARSRSGLHAVAPDKLAPGAFLGEHYQILRALGQGAMGAVYEVERTSDKLHLAAKVLSGKSDRKDMIRFVREARILAHLKHPNLVAIMDIDVSLDGGLFLVMELVQGKTLKDAKARYREPGFAWTILRQICLGLQAIHAQGIIHRDLKPANVLLAEGPEGLLVKIADFGISKLGNAQAQTLEQEGPAARSPAAPAEAPPAPVVRVSAENPQADEDPFAATADVAPEDPFAATADVASPFLATDAAAVKAGDQAAMKQALANVAHVDLASAEHLTKTGVALGTPLYMAPELADGSRNAPIASDIFSLGVIAFELLTGTLPFTEPPVYSIWQGRALTVQRLSVLRPDLPPELAARFQRCLSSNPAERPTLTELLANMPSEPHASNQKQ